MVKQLSSLDLYYLTKELKNLENSKVDRIYHNKENPHELLLVVHVSGQGKNILRVMLPSLIFTDVSKDVQGIATGFCMMMRKFLEGSILRTIDQVGFERTLIMSFKRKDETFYLVLELFSKGNIIMCDKDMNIMNILEEQHWKDRSLKRKEAYQPPASLDIAKLTLEEIEKIINGSQRQNIVKTFAMDLKLGGFYAEELCALIGCDKASRTAPAAQVLKGIRMMLDMSIRANSSSDNVFPFEMTTIKAEKYYDSFNDAILKNIRFEDSNMQRYEQQKARVEAIIEQQSTILEQIEEEVAQNQDKAEIMYAKYQQLDEILQVIRDARKKHSWKEVSSRIKKDEKFSKVIKDIDEKNNSIIIELDEI